jgi:hypothetical protein
VITYNCLVHLAPPRRPGQDPAAPRRAA